jgi:hypothetical protein
MQYARIVFASMPVLAALACGGSGGSTTTPAALREATPSSAALSVDLAGASSTAMPTTAPADPGLAMMHGGDFPPVEIGHDGCHPHLLLRTEAVSRRLNRHLYKFLGRIDALLQENPITTTGTQEVWEHVYPSGLDVKFTVTLTGTNMFAWTLELRQGSTGDFTTVFSGTIDRTNATGPHQGTGTASLDLTALHSVIPMEPAQGTIDVTFDVTAARREVTLDAADVTWDTDGDPDDLPPVSPRNAHYVYLSEKGIGGSLKAADQMIFFCPANPTLARADVDLVQRWYFLTDGSLHGRADALMKNGQLTETQQVVGLTCHARPAPPTMVPASTDTGHEVMPDAEGYWLMKLEDGGMVTTTQQAGSPTSCDPIFGEVPAADSTTNDFDFAGVSFTDGIPYPFPNMTP